MDKPCLRCAYGEHFQDCDEALRVENETLKGKVAALENDMPLQKACEEIKRLKETITELEKYITDHSEKE